MAETTLYLRQAETWPGDIVLGQGDAGSLRLYTFIARYLYGRSALRTIRENKGHARETQFAIETAREALEKFRRVG